MFVEVDGARLFFDVENPGLVADGARMREKPVLLLLHGGPGFDHSAFKPAFAGLTDVAQVVYYDHRGNGRSGGHDPADWNLARWGDDVRGFCDALGIEKPIVCGVSFGGYVAQSYATRHPCHPGKVILMSTAAKVDFPAIFDAFERLGGPGIREIAESYWMEPTAEGRARYIERCVPLYRRRQDSDGAFGRAILNTAVALHFNGPRNEHGRLDFRDALSRVDCPTLVLAGEDDPIMPVAFGEELARALPSDRVRFERLTGCAHVLVGDDPDRVFALLREFIQASEA